MISDNKWEPNPAFEVPKPLTNSPDANRTNLQVSNGKAIEQLTTQVEGIETVSDDDSSTASMTWDNKPDGLSEVDIADLYSEKDWPPFLFGRVGHVSGL